MKMQKKLLAVAISGTLALLSAAPASAHEIDKLRAQIEAMTKRLDQLEQQTAQAEQKAMAAEAKTMQMEEHAKKQMAKMDSMAKPDKGVMSGNDKVRLSLSGHVNRGLLWADDGDEDNVYHVDNDASSTRLRLIGEADVSNDLTVGAAMEVQFESNSSASVNQLNETNVGNDNFTQRRLEIYFDNKRLGKLWIGQGWTASEGTSEVDLSGTDLAGYSDPSVFAGGIRFRDTGGMLTGTDVGDVFNNLDGLSRKDRVRYDTPTIAGFTAAASLIEGDAWDTALRYAADYSGMKVAGAIAYSDPNTPNVDNQVNGSVSVLLAGGLNLTLAAGEQDKITGADPSFYYGKVGYQTRLSNAGMTAFSVDYNRSDDAELAGDEGTAYGVQAVQKFDAWATEAYIGWRTHELNRVGTNVQDIDAVIAGARVKF